jgi:hypothetical protein
MPLAEMVRVLPRIEGKIGAVVTVAFTVTMKPHTYGAGGDRGAIADVASLLAGACRDGGLHR